MVQNFYEFLNSQSPDRLFGYSCLLIIITIIIGITVVQTAVAVRKRK